MSKYNRLIGTAKNTTGHKVSVDVYDVLVAFAVTCPARQHAIKKLLCAGMRGGKSELQDLQEAGQSVARAIELVESYSTCKRDELSSPISMSENRENPL